MSAILENSEAAIFNRVFQPNVGDFPRAAAAAIIGIGFDEVDRTRMAQLLEKAQLGTLSVEEAETLENYRHVGKLRELLKSRARRSLQTL